MECCYRSAVAVTPHDTNDQWGSGTTIPVTRGLYVGVAGDVTVKMNGATVLFKAAPVGILHGIQVTRIMATGTTATNIVALF